jgi:hypothetical protein
LGFKRAYLENFRKKTFFQSSIQTLKYPHEFTLKDFLMNDQIIQIKKSYLWDTHKTINKTRYKFFN